MMLPAYTSCYSNHHRGILLLTPIDPPNLHLYDVHESFILSTIFSSKLVRISISKTYSQFTMDLCTCGTGGHLTGVYGAVGCCAERGNILAYFIYLSLRMAW